MGTCEGSSSSFLLSSEATGAAFLGRVMKKAAPMRTAAATAPPMAAPTGTPFFSSAGGAGEITGWLLTESNTGLFVTEAVTLGDAPRERVAVAGGLALGVAAGVPVVVAVALGEAPLVRDWVGVGLLAAVPERVPLGVWGEGEPAGEPAGAGVPLREAAGEALGETLGARSTMVTPGYELLILLVRPVTKAGLAMKLVAFAPL